jgi:hypothetical protein
VYGKTTEYLPQVGGAAQLYVVHIFKLDGELIGGGSPGTRKPSLENKLALSPRTWRRARRCSLNHSPLGMLGEWATVRQTAIIEGDWMRTDEDLGTV